MSFYDISPPLSFPSLCFPLLPFPPTAPVPCPATGLVVVMSEVLADSGLFCMTMLVTVWIADQYYAIFCNTPTAKKYWPK